MPTILTGSNLSFTTTFSLNSTPKQFIFVDNNAYTAASIPLSGVRGDFTITSPSGVVVYNNTSFGAGSDIVANVSLTNAITIPLPNLANQSPEQGLYVVLYNVQINDGVNPQYYINQTQTYNLVYNSPRVCITEQVDCIQPLFTTTDITNYIVNSVTPTNARTITLEYPANSGGSPIVNTTSATITTPVFYTGMQSVTVSSILTYQYSNFIVTDTVEGTRSINVDCTFICQLVCCLNSLNNRLEASRGTNSILFEQLSDQFNQAMSKVGLLLTNIDCGKQQTANKIIAEIRAISNCTNDCNCTDGTPSKVTGIGNINNVNVIVQSGGTPITVTSNVSGGVTTYTVSFDQTLVTKINNSYNTVVLQGTGVTITNTGIIGGVQTYTVNGYAPTNSLWLRCSITIVAGVVTITKTNILSEGSNMQNPTILESNTLLGANEFTVSAFQVSGNNNYKVWIQDEEIAGTAIYNMPKVYALRVLNQTSNNFKFQFTNLSGNPVTDAYLVSLINSSPTSSIILNILIKE